MIVVMSTSPHQVVLVVVVVVDSFISIDAGNTSVGKLALPVGTLCMTAWKLALRLESALHIGSLGYSWNTCIAALDTCTAAYASITSCRSTCMTA